jgi:hypothetical protein
MPVKTNSETLVNSIQFDRLPYSDIRRRLKFDTHLKGVYLTLGVHNIMEKYKVGFIYNRCFIQKTIKLPSGVSIIPMTQTGSSGEIHDAKKQLESARFTFTRKDLENTLKNFANTGHCTLILFESVEAKDFIHAIESKEMEAENIMGAVSVISANPGIPLCSYAEGSKSPGVKFFIPPDRIIQHVTCIPGFLDALPDIEKKAQEDPKFSLLLKLFRSSLREREVDNQILFQLILFEEASDNESGSCLAEKLRNFSERIGFSGDLAIVASECGIGLPKGKDVIDLLVKLRNSAAHNGNISEESLKQYNGDWVVPILSDKTKLHILITEALRYMFCCLVGHTRDNMAIKVTEPIEIRFD